MHKTAALAKRALRIWHGTVPMHKTAAVAKNAIRGWNGTVPDLSARFFACAPMM